MNVVLKICGRDALAVWTLSYITSWRLSPDMLLARLVSEPSYASEKFPIAFNISAINEATLIPSAQWYELKNLIERLEHDLTNMNLPKLEDRKTWKKKSIEEFWEYGSGYVWLDEFSQWYERFINNYWVTEENENTTLCFNPVLPKSHAEYFEMYERQNLFINHYNSNTWNDFECREATQFIKLPFFLTALEFSPQNKGCDITNEVFSRLLDKGLKLHFSEPGNINSGIKIPNGDVKCALHRIDDALYKTDIPRDKLFNQEIIKTESGLEISLFDILIGRDNVIKIYWDMGFNFYPWVKIPWPYTDSDCDDYPISDTSKRQREHERAIAERMAATAPTSFDDTPLPNHQYLLDNSLFNLMKKYGLEKADRKKQATVLTRWQHSLTNELNVITPQQYNGDKTRCEDRRRKLNTKIEECSNYVTKLYESVNEEKESIHELNEQQFEATPQPSQKHQHKKTKSINSKFACLEGLHPRNISVVMDEDRGWIVYQKKRIEFYPQDFSIKKGSQPWKLLEGAAVSSGVLAASLSKLNKSSDLEKETSKTRTAISRVNKVLKQSIGLIENPVIFDSGYRFIFKSMTHKMLNGEAITKGADAMQYQDVREFDEPLNILSNDGNLTENIDESDWADFQHD